jgi:hypothetical protein
MSIASSAVIVEMNISVWTANKLDRETTEDVTLTNHAVRNAVQVRKNLMAGTSKRKEIADYAAGCRNWHNTRTLPWADRGPRLLPTSLFMDYKTEANVRRSTFNYMVQEFGKVYPSLVAQAPTTMGTLFNPDDYPSVDEVMSKFSFQLTFSPVPEAGDFRLDVSNQDLRELQQQYEESFDARLADAMRAPWQQLHTMLTGMSAKLTEEGGDTKKRWHGSFVTNAQELCQMLTHLNVTKDPKLEQARRELEAVMLGAEIEDIKDSEATRAHMKAKIDTILGGFDW